MYIYSGRFSIKHLREHVSDIERIHFDEKEGEEEKLTPFSYRFDDIVNLLFHKEIKSKLVDGDRWSIPRLHILAACGKLSEEQVG